MRAHQVRTIVYTRRRTLSWYPLRPAARPGRQPSRAGRTVTAMTIDRWTHALGAPTTALPPDVVGAQDEDGAFRTPVTVELAAHPERQVARAVTLPRETSEGAKRTASLVVSTWERPAINRNFNAHVWKSALCAAGVESGRDTGCHQRRHWYASALLDSGESIKAVSEYLGHADEGFTLRTHTHPMPNSEDRMRRAIDAAFAAKVRGAASATEL